MRESPKVCAPECATSQKVATTLARAATHGLASSAAKSKDVGIQARNILDAWLAWASRSKLESFVKLARAI